MRQDDARKSCSDDNYSPLTDTCPFNMIFDEEGQSPISLVADFSGDISSLFELKDITTLPLLPLRNMMLLPAVVAPVSIGRSSSRMLIDTAVKSDQ